ncbi:MAG: hypothetical protein JWL97_1958 [Gemmatimonadales bacterium]|nr:hypothetical protein [Gemmatimonadales bacterium]
MGFEQADRASEFGLDVVGNGFAHRSSRRSRPVLERLYESDEPVSLERKNEVREGRALQSWRKERTLVVRAGVHYQRAAECWWKRCVEPGIRQGGGGDYRERGNPVARHRRHFAKCCSKQNVVLESKQGLRETLEERGIRSHQNYFGHPWCRLLNQPVVESFQDLLRESPLLWSAR